MDKKQCSKCKKKKHLSKYYGDKRASDGLHSSCRSCHTKATMRWKEKNKEYLAGFEYNRKLIKKYGITIVDYNLMGESQDWKCACCGKPNVKLCVDHDHQTGRVRGLLCKFCNLGIGGLGDTLEGCKNAVKYMEKIYGN